MKQVWFCERCCHVGCVAYEGDEGAFSVITCIADAHKDVSASCSVPVTGLRVINPTVINSLAALVADRSIPSWVVESASALFFPGEK